ncbi:MAG: translation initiation factor IF-2 [Patescibacteria group bacterium]
MNVTELARQLKITTSELFDKLPSLGFDIGRRAIKVDDKIAFKIIEVWKHKAKEEREKSRIEEIRGTAQEEAVAEKTKQVELPSLLTVREFASLLDLPVNKVLGELMKNGVLVSLNEKIDFDTASIISEELGYQVSSLDESDSSSEPQAQQRLESILSEKDENFTARPPVVVVMGHVDHGKTKILDAIRKTDVVSTESGGITQHIGAYQVHRHERTITFIDTPGHEAFTAMRSRGARAADIAVLVIAADDSIQPQTKEAIKIITDAKLPFVVAINKVDKPEANIEKVKQDLASIGLQPDDWGGSIMCVPVSAKEGTGIEDLLEAILLLADMDKEKIMADPNRLAIGTAIESHIDKGEGPVATILIQAGTLRVGDSLCLDNSLYGKVKALRDYKGMGIAAAGPGTPAKILGLKLAPAVGSILEVPSDLKCLEKNLKTHKMRQEKDFSTQSSAGESKALNFIIKADVLGSLGAIVESLAKLETKEIKIKIVSKGLGMITEADVLKAETTKAKIIGFHVKPTPNVSDLARDKGVVIDYYEVIYHLIESVQKDMADMKEEEVKKELIGKLEILKVFRKENKNMIVGGRVQEGQIKVCDTGIVTRDGKPVSSGKIVRVECAKQVVDKAVSGSECGVGFEGKPVIEPGDILEFYQAVE